MGKISINDAVFIFMAKGEKLKDSDVFPSNGTPDQKYVLWPRGEGWDVRYLVFGSKGIEWLPISESIFTDESEAWQSAYGHWMNLREKLYASQQSRDASDSKLSFNNLKINNVF